MKPDQKPVSIYDQTNLVIIRQAMKHAVKAHPNSLANALDAFWTFMVHTFQTPDPQTAFNLGVRFALQDVEAIHEKHFGETASDGPHLEGPWAAGRTAVMNLSKQLTSARPGVWRASFEYPFQLDHFWWPENEPYPKVNIAAIECDGVAAVAIEGLFEFALLVDQPMILLPACRELTVRYEVIP